MQPFTISLKTLKVGVTRFDWHSGKELFEAFGNEEILDADLRIVADVDYKKSSVSVKCAIDGTVVVECDRCLESLTLPVQTSFDEDGYDVAEDLDLSQDIYDFVCTSLPLQRVHPEGECNQETVKFLSK